MYRNDTRTVVTLDAGGTNFVFSAIRGNQEVVEPVTLPSCAKVLDDCLASMVKGFNMVLEELDEVPVAISFAFPGPAAYPDGIIGGYLPNFPSFRDGVALGAFLERKFGIPVFINNDGDLYAYGEALAGALPAINERLRAAGSAKRYKNLVGYTLGTGLGIGIVIDGKLNLGDNSCVETFCLTNNKYPGIMLEDCVSIRAIKRVYGELSGNPGHGLEPKDIYDIAKGLREGDKEAAIGSFREMGQIFGDAIATTVTMIDGLVVIGGGPSAAHEFILPGVLEVMRSKIHTFAGDTLDRVQMKVYDLTDESQFADFAKGDSREVKIYGYEDTVVYDPQKRIGIMISELGANRAISLGAYAFALAKLDGLQG